MHASLSCGVHFVPQPRVNRCDGLKRNARKSRAQLQGACDISSRVAAEITKGLGHDTCVRESSSELVTSSESNRSAAAEPWLQSAGLHGVSSCTPPQHDQ
jgi:hypothetical protein